jgi:hypothetical protein
MKYFIADIYKYFEILRLFNLESKRKKWQTKCDFKTCFTFFKYVRWAIQGHHDPLVLLMLNIFWHFCIKISVSELRECLDPAKADEMTLSEAAKTEIILAGNCTYLFYITICSTHIYFQHCSLCHVMKVSIKLVLVFRYLTWNVNYKAFTKFV